MPGKKIVVLDDSEVCREVVRIALERRGHTVVGLDSPFGLTRALDEERPDLLLVDVTMPGLTGDRVARIVLNHQHHRCPVVFYSDHPDEELAGMVASSGAAGYIRKSSTMERLALAVEDYLRKK
jgi:DNA-binding NtrC family response regulator